MGGRCPETRLHWVSTEICQTTVAWYLSRQRSDVLRFLLVIVTSAIALPVLCSVHAAQVKSVHFYIALDGNDSWSGELPAPNKSGADGPFASLQRARDEVRSLRKKGHLRDIPVTVTLRGGRYRVTDTLSLTEEDSGSEKAPMVYQAMPGEHARLIGGVSLTGFTPVTDPAILARLDPQARCKALQVDLKSLGVSRRWTQGGVDLQQQVHASRPLPQRKSMDDDHRDTRRRHEVRDR